MFMFCVTHGMFYFISTETELAPTVVKTSDFQQVLVGVSTILSVH